MVDQKVLIEIEEELVSLIPEQEREGKTREELVPNIQISITDMEEREEGEEFNTLSLTYGWKGKELAKYRLDVSDELVVQKMTRVD